MRYIPQSIFEIKFKRSVSEIPNVGLLSLSTTYSRETFLSANFVNKSYNFVSSVRLTVVTFIYNFCSEIYSPIVVFKFSNIFPAIKMSETYQRIHVEEKKIPSKKSKMAWIERYPASRESLVMAMVPSVFSTISLKASFMVAETSRDKTGFPIPVSETVCVRYSSQCSMFSRQHKASPKKVEHTRNEAK